MGKRQPEAPDPAETAAAQAASNRETAIAQHELNMVNQTGPWGSVNYRQTGTSANGTPTYTSTTTLSPSQRAIFDRTQAAQGNLASIAQNQSSFLQNYLGQQIDTSGLPAIQSNANLATSYAGANDFSADRRRVEDALWQRTAGDRSAADADLRTTLANKGLTEGSAAWNSEMERMGRQNTDARLATILAGGQEQSRLVGLARDAAQFGNDARLQQVGLNNSARQQGLAELFGLRNQPLNEISALLGGTQVSNPAQMGAAAPQTSVAGTNVAGIQQQAYQNQLQQYQSGMGGLFGLGGSLLGAAGNAGGFGMLFSDERLKTDVEHVGWTIDGTPIYTYRYVWGGPVQMGVMAQDVPEAAQMHDSGYLVVNYEKVH